ncbi:hypothetical protein [Rheinheimera sp. 1928-s]|uniref:acyltransferase n=1 Tax=Rheinheimera sp. 1928-s TaxID=3033803 RepID=UPI00262784B4|nr:hypothetical protein [Rheinheimera sp. 1928-s]MDF3125762.1 hypothetical protein [Rheinheimera sp. 1928-s]
MILNYIKKMGNERNGFSYIVYLFFIYMKKYNVFGPFIFVIMIIYSYFLSARLFGISFLPKVFFSNGVFRVRLVIQKRAFSIIKNGSLIFEKWRSGSSTSLYLAEDSILEIENTFTVGDNCKISLFKSSKLNIKGGAQYQSSGITADTIILCFKSVTIGEGSIISWNCYITDSSQHEFNGSLRIESVSIGDHVWISESVSVGPGTCIGNGSVVGAKSYLNKKYPSKSFIAGCPGKIKASDVNWKR